MKKTDIQKEIQTYIKNIFGFKPGNVFLYEIAFTHKSISTQKSLGQSINNERLEYLGDAILSAVVAEYCFKKFPLEQEGFLTEMRSKIVNREQLNHLGKKFEILRHFQKANDSSQEKAIAGNVLEAFIGALFLDKGWEKSKKIIVEKIINLNLDIETLKNQVFNYKSKLIFWAQKEKKVLEFRRVGGRRPQSKIYHIEIYLNKERIAEADALSVKKAEELAAEKAAGVLKI